LKLKCDVLLSTSAFKFNMCRYLMAYIAADAAVMHGGEDTGDAAIFALESGAAAAEAVAAVHLARPMQALAGHLVGRCTLTLSNPR
jgi:hypothetical protein